MPVALWLRFPYRWASALTADIPELRTEPVIDRLMLGDFALRSGQVLAGAQLTYATWGRLNSAADNVVLLPTYYTGTHNSYLPWIGPGRALDPQRWFIVSPDLFGNGLSSSPSHAATPQARAAWPQVSVLDNVAAQQRLLSHLGVRSVALTMGWSMGAMQSLQWATAEPGMIRAVLAVCGTANCWPLNRAFLGSVRAALTADPHWQGGAYAADAPPRAGLRAFGRVYCPWAYSAEFFRDGLYRQLGCETQEAFLRAWEDEHLAWDACDLLAMLATWESADVAALCGGSLAQALGRISARVILMPGDRDAYFTLEEAQIEQRHIQRAQLQPLRSAYGHCAGAPGRFADETQAITQAAWQLLR